MNPIIIWAQIFHRLQNCRRLTKRGRYYIFPIEISWHTKTEKKIWLAAQLMGREFTEIKSLKRGMMMIELDRSKERLYTKKKIASEEIFIFCDINLLGLVWEPHFPKEN
ncbi:hypothetical protein ACJX0J_006608 [Zea mays]